MLGKRQRSYMRRTTSMAEVAAAAKQGRSQGRATRGASPYLPFSSADAAATGVGGAGLAPAMNWGDFSAVETAPFLKNCGLCKGRLGPGRDTFMYRGEVAFCSLECREQQINLDERKEKNCSLTSIKEGPPVSGAGGSDQSGNGETVAAA